MIRLQAEPFDAGHELAAFTARVAGAGAIVTFLGLVRGEGTGDTVAALELEYYPRLTERTVAAIGEDARDRFDLTGFAILHRTGALPPGEPIVFVAAAAAHRRAAFEAVDYMMDRLKTDAAFWKREHGSNGSRWIEAREADLRDRTRWE